MRIEQTDPRVGIAIYVVIVVALGLLGAWTGPLTWDESRYYKPAVEYFAERFPSVPLDYPMPMPPLPLMVQGCIFRVTGSLLILRLFSSLAAIAAVAVAATVVRASRSGVLLVVMIGSFPSILANAFTLKHYTLLLLLLVGATVQWIRGRVVFTTLLLAAACLTHQIAAALVLAFVSDALLSRRFRDSLLIASAAAPLVLLVLSWGAMRPPMYGAAFSSEPSVGSVHAAQFLVLLVVAGVWLAPGLRLRPITASLLFPVAAALIHFSSLMRDGSVYERLAGPISSAISLVGGRNYPLMVTLAGLAVACGLTIGHERNRMIALWVLAYGGVMIFVPYFFESYYAMFVAISWTFLRDRFSARHWFFPLAVILAGVVYTSLQF